MKRMSWDVKDENIVDDLVALLCISSEECKLLQTLQQEAEKISKRLVDEYYDLLIAHELTNEFITNLPALKSTLAQWFVKLFCGNYDKDYASDRLRIGMAHVRIGLPVRYPLAMFAVLDRYGVEVAEKGGEAAVNAFRKVLALDVATFTQAYDNTQLNNLKDLVGGSGDLARRLLHDEY
ncbi:Globin-coupled histidine kinase [Serratia fonticola]|uniref:protoglobin domain-containing protein n=1 Tax=Serratia fonticola TaxID=47917 RepID=UPI0004651839|nr:protoglobin domain-containing protein [Serratia fonticola]AKG69858.1 Globin-coupled histidine kinase [Serratia fonticola]CAI1636250.1 Globin-coupled histidine kinase [Serratia fonticola]